MDEKGRGNVRQFNYPAALALGRVFSSPHLAELFVSPLHGFFDLRTLQIPQRLGDILLKVMRSRMRIAVSPAQRLRNNRINDAQLFEMAAG